MTVIRPVPANHRYATEPGPVRHALLVIGSVCTAFSSILLAAFIIGAAIRAADPYGGPVSQSFPEVTGALLWLPLVSVVLIAAATVGRQGARIPYGLRTAWVIVATILLIGSVILAMIDPDKITVLLFAFVPLLIGWGAGLWARVMISPYAGR